VAYIYPPNFTNMIHPKKPGNKGTFVEIIGEKKPGK